MWSTGRTPATTVVLDLESGAVVFVGDGKGGEALKPFWRRLRRCRAKVEAVAMDMSPAYRNAVSAHLPGAVIVFDRFHVIKLLDDKLSGLRRSLYHPAAAEQKKVLKGRPVAIAEEPGEPRPAERDEAARLEEALALNKPLAVAYYLKEDLRRFWEQPGKRFAAGVPHRLGGGGRRRRGSGCCGRSPDTGPASPATGWLLPVPISTAAWKGRTTRSRR